MRGTAVDDSAARIDQRPLRSAQCRKEIGARRFRQFAGLEAIHPLTVAGDRQAARAMKHARPVLHILRYVEHDGTRAARARDFECRAYRRFQFGRIGDQEHVLGHRAQDGARKLYQIITDKRSSDHTGSIGGVEEADAAPMEMAPRDTLTPDDMQVEWQAPPAP